MHAQSLKSCPALCYPMDCSLPGSFVHGILQARILKGLPCPPPGHLPDPGIEPTSPALQVDSEPPTKPILVLHALDYSIYPSPES